MKLTNIKHIFFDLDHTLWDFDKNSALTFNKIFRLNGIEIDVIKFLEIYEPINLHYWKLYRENQLIKSELRYKRLKESFDQMDIRVDDAIINQLSIDYIEYLTSFNHLFEDTLDILNYLAPNYQLHIITNGFEEVQLRKITNSNIQSYFKTITNSEMVGVKKPNPGIFQYALNQAGAVVTESIMIGDNFEADIQGALNVGLEVLFFNYHRIPFKKNIKTIKSLKEIKIYL